METATVSAKARRPAWARVLLGALLVVAPARLRPHERRRGEARDRAGGRRRRRLLTPRPEAAPDGI